MLIFLHCCLQIHVKNTSNNCLMKNTCNIFLTDCPPEKVFLRHQRLEFTEIISYKADPSLKWLAITGLMPEVCKMTIVFNSHGQLLIFIKKNILHLYIEMVDALRKFTCLIKVCMRSESYDLNIKIKCTCTIKKLRLLYNYKQSK